MTDDPQPSAQEQAEAARKSLKAGIADETASAAIAREEAEGPAEPSNPE